MQTTPSPGDTIVVWFSHGAASAVAAYKTIEKYGATCDVRLVNNPIVEEDGDNLRFAKDVAKWLRCPVEYAVNPNYPSASTAVVWDHQQAMVFPHGAPCTRHLKKFARQHYENTHRVDWHVLGFTADEKSRFDSFRLGERRNTLPILIDANLTKDDCAALLAQHGIKLPRIYAEGYPNANCIGCVKATSPTYWQLVRKTRPGVFKERVEQSRRLGARLVRYKGKRIFLDELPIDATGRPLKTMTVECGIFCEEKT
jgi:3'-phosphoadenosine 5'-phosphosulfate sulfotransferase (PAPS reductase)/FAD synthetase